MAGILDARAERWNRARDRIERALAIDPRDPDARDAMRKLEARGR
ncbi:MAG: hypothetical protein ACOCXM_11095 [Myxococcota bacterium]